MWAVGKDFINGCVGRGNAGPVESEENQRQVSHLFPPSLGRSHTPRPIHIPTALLRPDGKVENPKTGFPLSRCGSR
jgi:hypothetical protein